MILIKKKFIYQIFMIFKNFQYFLPSYFIHIIFFKIFNLRIFFYHLQNLIITVFINNLRLSLDILIIILYYSSTLYERDEIT
jgi:hypothetical protein